MTGRKFMPSIKNTVIAFSQSKEQSFFSGAAIMIMRSIFTQASVQLHFLCFCFHSVILFSFCFLFFVFLFFLFLAFFTIAIVKQPHFKRISLHIHPVLHPITLCYIRSAVVLLGLPAYAFSLSFAFLACRLSQYLTRF